MITREQLHEACVLLKEKVARNEQISYFGICTNLVDILRPKPFEDNITDLLSSYYENWPKYSGSPFFPVPGYKVDDHYFSEIDAYYGGNIWEGEYGQNRKELLDHLINVTKK
jgi:hypothetical protein